jgi:hypothetical protein
MNLVVLMPGVELTASASALLLWMWNRVPDGSLAG